MYGSVFLDNNQNGAYDEGDAPIEATTVYVTDQAETTVLATYATGSNGVYSLTVPAARYLFQ